MRIEAFVKSAAVHPNFVHQQMRFRFLLVGLALALVFSLTAAVMIGAVNIEPLTVWRIAFARLGGTTEGDWSAAQANIVWYIRFPRVLLAAVVGAGLAVVGATMQAVTRNPLADPFLLGMSSGASAGAVVVMLLGVGTGVYALSLGAFFGAMLAFGLVFALALRRGGAITPGRMILAGVAVSYFFSALTSFITLRDADSGSTRRVLTWLLGSFGGTRWEEVLLPALALLLGTGYLVLQARKLNTLAVGDETAGALGVEVNHFRKQLLVITALLTGVMVAVSGIVGFVGLMMPHGVRLLVGADHRRVLPVSILAGACFLVWVDVVARTVFAPQELPIGIITALIGVPFFLGLLLRDGHEATH